jgi:hypothetical protein
MGAGCLPDWRIISNKRRERCRRVADLEHQCRLASSNNSAFAVGLSSMIGFGIDFAGYTTGKTSLVAIEIAGRRAQATLLRGSALSAKRQSNGSLPQILSQEVAVLRRCLSIGPVAVDIPIDLQDLARPDRAEFVWQLTLRPIDRAVGAMPALADRIGAPVARFAAIMRAGEFGAILGERLFEAYPAGTLKALKIEAGQYKGKNGVDALNSLCKTLKIAPPVDSDDDIDAIICAITAAAPMDAVHQAEALKVQGPMPRGFRIPNSLSFDRIETRVAQFEGWMAERGAGA